MTIQDIYNIFNTYAPFSLQESYDKSGLLVGDPMQTVKTVLLTLDITAPVVAEAADKKADLIISHHPVIWEPLRSIAPTHPVWNMVRYQIGAICSHTCLDIAKGGLNDYFGELLSRSIPMQPPYQPLAELSEGRTLGRAADLVQPTDVYSLTDTLQSILGCNSLRYYPGRNSGLIRKIAWCTGSGGDLIQDAIRIGADVLITGDCKHSVWAEAQNFDFTLIDCGHFETEFPVIGLFRRILKNAAPDLILINSEKGSTPFFQTIR